MRWITHYSNLQIDVDVLYKNENIQINVLCGFRNAFNIEEREIIHNIFIMTDFNYCSIVWHVCDKAWICKIGKTQERALWFLSKNNLWF